MFVTGGGERPLADLEVAPHPRLMAIPAYPRRSTSSPQTFHALRSDCEIAATRLTASSVDSDYDVRFLYVRRPEWYFSVNVERRRDVIELPIDGVLDINGWDLRKACQLFRKSNPPLLEWLHSPIVYKDRFGIAQSLRDLLPLFFSAKACSYHYLSMAKNNYRGYLRGEHVWTKKYFYLLRPILAIRWIELGLGVPPTEFTRMVEPTVESADLLAEIESLLEAKRSGRELDLGPKIEPIHRFIEEELRRHEAAGGFGRGRAAKGVEKLDALLRDAVEMAWT
jgi:predicted nucleotidyltransferase